MSGARREAAPRGGAAAAPAGPLRRFWDQVGWLVTALALALAIRAFVIEPYRIPSGSMFPTLLIGDHLFVNKFLYGIHVPGTGWRLPGLRAPQRGDVIVFTVARDTQALRPELTVRPADRHRELPRDRFVKRIVGLPGDRVEVRDVRVLVNGVALDAEKTGERFLDEGGRELTVRVERLDECTHAVLDDPLRRGPEGIHQVEPGRYFVMGDNRDYSNDSRSWGTVRLAEVKGPAFLIYWSWDWNGGWLELLDPRTWWRNLVHRTRWTRTGDSVGCLEPGEPAVPDPDAH